MKIKAAVIGMGIGQKHLEAIENYKNSEVKIICEKSKKKFLFLKKKYPNKFITLNEDDVFKDNEINLVSIASYDNDHYRQIIKSIKYNKNIIVEKPMCLTINEFKNISKILKRKTNIKITSNMVLRTNSLFKYFKKKIKNEKIYYIEADYLWGRLEKLKGWRSKLKNYSITLGAGIHMIDLVIWMLNLKPTHVWAYGNDIATKKISFKKKSFAIYVFEFPKNIIAKVTVNAAAAHNHFHEVKIFSKNSTFVNSNLGSFQSQRINNRIFSKRIFSDYPDKKNRKKLIQNFIDFILKKVNSPIITFKEQKNLMSVCFATDKALKTKKKVKIK